MCVPVISCDEAPAAGVRPCSFLDNEPLEERSSLVFPPSLLIPVEESLVTPSAPRDDRGAFLNLAGSTVFGAPSCYFRNNDMCRKSKNYTHIKFCTCT